MSANHKANPLETSFDAIVRANGFALGVRADEESVLGVEFLHRDTWELIPRNRLAREASRQIRAYLDKPGFRFDLPLGASGTCFQNRVWRAIAAIPAGHTLSYAMLAVELGSAARAVGQACGANPFPVIVPCHRVVSADGLGGFAHHRDGFLLDIKRWLLAHEGGNALLPQLAAAAFEQPSAGY